MSRVDTLTVYHLIHDAHQIVCIDAVLERLAPPFEDVAAALRQLIQEEPAVVRPRPLARQRHLAAADQPRI